jgi:hypothetical protein
MAIHSFMNRPRPKSKYSPRPTVADGILDKLAHNAHLIEMRGDSMRKNRGKPKCIASHRSQSYRVNSVGY